MVDCGFLFIIRHKGQNTSCIYCYCNFPIHPCVPSLTNRIIIFCLRTSCHDISVLIRFVVDDGESIAKVKNVQNNKVINKISIYSSLGGSFLKEAITSGRSSTTLASAESFFLIGNNLIDSIFL